MIQLRVVKILIWMFFGLVVNLLMNNVVIHNRVKHQSSLPTTSHFTSPSTVKVPQEKIWNWNEVAVKFNTRLLRLRKICNTKPRPPVIETEKHDGKIVLKYINGLRKHWKPIREFLVDIPRRLLICAVPKSGSTSWHRLLWTVRRQRMNLSNDQSLYTPTDTIENEAIALNLDTEKGDKLITYAVGDDDFTQSPPTNSSFRVILARHPFARFISGWNQKFLRTIDYSRKLFKTFPKLLQYKSEVHTDRAISFVDFARFAAENQKDVRSKDAHFAPATKLCSPCEYDYTYVVKAESIDADQPWLMKRLGLSDVNLGRHGSPWSGSVVNVNLKESIKKFILGLKPEVIKGLYELYRDDFEFFGYTFDFETLEAGGFEME